jgi:coenzyme PQQ precursor peptide PqqA
MDWQKPSFEEINMSAEIGAYQGDDDGRDNEPTVTDSASDREA